MDRAVGQNICRLRMERGISQEKLGDALHLTFQQIQKYEKGTNRVAASRLKDIADVLKVPVSQLFSDAEKLLVASSPAVDALATHEGNSLMRSFLSLRTPKLRSLVVNMVREIAATQA
jgi:transcriptional regulator with XRE-family HTH domain